MLIDPSILIIIDDDGGVIPLHSLGVSDTQQSQMSLNDLMAYALANLSDASKEGGYAIRLSTKAIPDFGFARLQASKESDMQQRNLFAAAYPVLFPYGIGGMEDARPNRVSFKDHIQWALQYYDKRFATHHSFIFVAFGILQKRNTMQSAYLQMCCQDFDVDSHSISLLTVADLKQAELQETRKEPISNLAVRLLRKHVVATNGRVMGSDHARAAYQGMIWGTCLFLGGASLWVTINPANIHDPVAQVFAGENIDMDKFSSTLGPDANHRATNIASNPYAAAKYFRFIILTVLDTLFGIKSERGYMQSTMGILGQLVAYFGVVEAQGRGSLHLHMLLWLRHSPNSTEMHNLLQSFDFRDRIRTFIKANIRAHIDGLTEDTIRLTPRDSQLPYSRPPDPRNPTWLQDNAQFESRLVRSQQIHTCTRATCLRVKNRQLSCKRRAPWPRSDEDFVEPNGNWGPKRTVPYINAYCPDLLTSMRCNNDIKLNTNGCETKHIAWYLTAYTTKNQQPTHNTSALLASTMAYHKDNPKYNDLRQCNKLLLYRCTNVLNRQMELSAPQVVSYLMGWDDTFQLHHYVPLFTTPLLIALKRAFPEFRSKSNVQYVIILGCMARELK